MDSYFQSQGVQGYPGKETGARECRELGKELMPETCFIGRVPCSEVQGAVNSNRYITLF
jgi:hypothetical protein